jgi:hypothetical protein
MGGSSVKGCCMGPWHAALQRRRSENLRAAEHQIMALRELPDSLHAEILPGWGLTTRTISSPRMQFFLWRKLSIIQCRLSIW